MQGVFSKQSVMLESVSDAVRKNVRRDMFGRMFQFLDRIAHGNRMSCFPEHAQIIMSVPKRVGVLT